MDAVGRVLARYHPADPLHGAHVKLPVAQLWRLGDAGGGALSLHGHPVVRVEVVGTVVRRHVTDGRLVFVVDDTSGLVEVLVWERRYEREPLIAADDVVLGALVRVRGRISAYQGRPQITAFAVALLPNDSTGVAEEMAHWREMQALGAGAYRALASLPPALAAERAMLLRIVQPNGEPIPAGASMLELCGHASWALGRHSTGTATERELLAVLNNDPATRTVDPPALREALRLLCDNGGAYWGTSASGEPTVTHIGPQSNLATAVLAVVRAAAAPVDERAIAQALWAEPRWSCVRASQVASALAHLARESHVFDNGEGRWKLFT